MEIKRKINLTNFSTEKWSFFMGSALAPRLLNRLIPDCVLPSFYLGGKNERN